MVSCPNCICMYMFVSLEYYPLTALTCQPVGQGSTYNSDCNKVNIHYSSNQNLIQIHNFNKVITAPLSPLTGNLLDTANRPDIVLAEGGKKGKKN